MSKNKRILFAAGILSAAFLCGDLLYEPDLMNDSLPFIDLRGSVEQAMGNAQEAFALGESDPHTPQTDDDSATRVSIYVYAETIRMNENTYTVQQIRSEILSGRYAGKTVYLVDNYAETETFKQLIAILEDNEDKIGGFRIQ